MSDGLFVNDDNVGGDEQSSVRMPTMGNTSMGVSPANDVNTNATTWDWKTNYDNYVRQQSGETALDTMSHQQEYKLTPDLQVYAWDLSKRYDGIIKQEVFDRSFKETSKKYGWGGALNEWNTTNSDDAKAQMLPNIESHSVLENPLPAENFLMVGHHTTERMDSCTW